MSRKARRPQGVENSEAGSFLSLSHYFHHSREAPGPVGQCCPHICVTPRASSFAPFAVWGAEIKVPVEIKGKQRRLEWETESSALAEAPELV